MSRPPARQRTAARLEVANNADAPICTGPMVACPCGNDIRDKIADADDLIRNLSVPPVGSANLRPIRTRDLASCLVHDNEGAIGPGHCD